MYKCILRKYVPIYAIYIEIFIYLRVWAHNLLRFNKGYCILIRQTYTYRRICISSGIDIMTIIRSTTKFSAKKCQPTFLERSFGGCYGNLVTPTRSNLSERIGIQSVKSVLRVIKFCSTFGLKCQ